jgi:alpha-tubulin suppressor-like RCC1 family protein
MALEHRYGQLGNPINQPTYRLPAHPSDDTQRNLPTPAKHVDLDNEKLVFTQAAAGTFHSGAIDRNGHAYLWGSNFEGQLCIGDTKDINYPIRTSPEYPTDDHGDMIPGAR